MKIEEIDKAIEVLKVCQYCWANQVIWGNEIITDYDAISQSIRCLEEFKISEEKIHGDV